jgi:hypothetical protein
MPGEQRPVAADRHARGARGDRRDRPALVDPDRDVVRKSPSASMRSTDGYVATASRSAASSTRSVLMPRAACSQRGADAGLFGELRPVM